MAGKGNTYRPVDKEKFEQNFDKIFNKKEHEHAEAMRAFASGEKLEFRPTPKMCGPANSRARQCHPFYRR